jgi:nucleoid-associated protein YgaU
MVRRVVILGTVLGSLLVMAACGDDSGGGAGDGDGADRPAASTSTSTTVERTTTTTTAVVVPDSYTVESGDTLWDIARRFGTTVEALAEANGITDPHLIEVGQVLEIPDAPRSDS